MYKSSYDLFLENMKIEMQESQILNEETTKDKMTFIGQNENMKKIEENFDKLIHLKDKKNGANIQSSKELKEIERLCEKEFGFKIMNIYTGGIYPDLMSTGVLINNIKERDQNPMMQEFLRNNPDMANALRTQDFINIISKQQVMALSALPSSFIIRASIYDMPELLVKKEKFYDYSHKYICCIFLPREYFDGELTAAEITACLLHEIGHNFDVSLNFYISDLLEWGLIFTNGKTLYEKLVMASATIVGKEIGIWLMKLQISIFSFLNKYGPTAFVLSMIEFLIKAMLDFINFLSISTSWITLTTTFKNLATVITTIPVNALINLYRTHSRFGSERFADSFATMYGYGPALIGFLNKLKGGTNPTTKPFVSKGLNKIVDNSPILQNAFFFFGTGASLLTMLSDPHPEVQTRCRMVLDDMEKLASNPNFSPKVKQALKQHHAAATHAYNDFLNVEPTQKKYTAERMSRIFKETYLGGKIDLRSYLMTCSAIQSGVIEAKNKES